MKWNRRQSHDCSDEQTRDTAHFHVIGNGGNRFCVSNAHCIDCYFEGLTAIYRHISTYYMLFERQGWAKSTRKNVAKSYVDVQITANMQITN